MSLRSVALFASVSLLLSFATGCAAEATEEAASSDAALMNPSNEGEFRLYDEGTEPNPACDVHTVLELAHPSANAPLQATLHEAVTGLCKIAVDPVERVYTLKLDRVDCGSKVYAGISRKTGERLATITDHRTRTCRDLVPAQIIVEEIDATKTARTLLSQDSSAAAR